MKYSIFMLRFLTPVHFGNAELGGKLEQVGLEYTSDSLFSALCWELRNLGETEYLASFCHKVSTGEIRFSDALPYTKEGAAEDYAFYIPKPVCTIEPTVQQKAATLVEVRKNATEQKQQKKMKYLRPSELQAYITALQQGKSYVSSVELGKTDIVERVNCRGDEPLPYYVGTYAFRPNGGLYILMQYEDAADQELISRLLEALGNTGIGGKRSSGLGKFLVEDPLFLEDEIGVFADDGILYRMLMNRTATQYMSLSTVIPNENEIPVVAAGQYMLRRRSGFTTGAGELKKRNSVYSIRSGSCFAKPLDGQMVVLDDAVEPPVWRNGKGLFVGLPI